TSSVTFFFSSRRRHTRCYRDWSSDVCSSDLFSLIWGLAIQMYETSVASYIWMASPQMREKLASIIENRFCAAAAPADRIVRLPSALIWMTLLESHHSG